MAAMPFPPPAAPYTMDGLNEHRFWGPGAHGHPSNSASPPQAPSPTSDDGGIGPATSSGIKSTPIVQRMSTGRLADDRQPITTSVLSIMLEKELARDRHILRSCTFLDPLFPAEKLPFPVDNLLLDQLTESKTWDPHQNCFTTKPTYDEPGMATWLNHLGDKMGEAFSKTPLRRWYHDFCNQPPDGSPIVRKPDLALMDPACMQEGVKLKKSWGKILALGEVTSSKKSPKRMSETVDAKSYILFCTQDDRRFAIALSFNGTGYFSLTVTDCQGQLRTGDCSLLEGKDNALTILKILAMLMFGSFADIGLDPTMIRGPLDTVQSFFVNNHRYAVVKRIYAVHALLGRGTKVYLVCRDSKFFIIKDSWVQPHRSESEVKQLEAIKAHAGNLNCIPTLVEHEDVKVHSEIDSTRRYRETVGLGTDLHWIHRRLVLTPVGEPIFGAQSKVEFLTVILDVINGTLSLSVALVVKLIQAQQPFSTSTITSRSSTGI